MKLIRFGDKSEERPGVLAKDGSRLDLSEHFDDWNARFFSQLGLSHLSEVLRQEALSCRRVEPTVRWAAPVSRPGKIICVGLNYKDHAAETNASVPAEPILFMKAPNTVVGPYDDIEVPRESKKMDWEVELGVVIGKEARYLATREDSLSCIAGYTICHDVSERAFQLERGGQWTKGKSCDTFNPLGPFLLTPDEVPNVSDLRLRLSVNGEIRQDGNTGNMIFDVPFLVHYISQFMTLEPGDLISTGTPAGIGLSMSPPRFLKVGDSIELAIACLGEQRQGCVRSR